METLPHRMSSALLEIWAILATWPFYALGLVLLGSWLQDHFDALLRSHEGKPSWIGYRLLRVRIRFTRRVIQRPFWYSNDEKIARELARANTALERGGFAPLTSIIETVEGQSDKAVEHLSAVEALIGGVGYQKAAILSYRILPAASSSDVVLREAQQGPKSNDPEHDEIGSGRADSSLNFRKRRRWWLPSITITINRG